MRARTTWALQFARPEQRRDEPERGTEGVGQVAAAAEPDAEPEREREPEDVSFELDLSLQVPLPMLIAGAVGASALMVPIPIEAQAILSTYGQDRETPASRAPALMWVIIPVAPATIDGVLKMPAPTMMPTTIHVRFCLTHGMLPNR